MKRLVTIENVTQPDPDETVVTYARIELRTMGSKRLPPKAVTFPDGTVGNVVSSNQDRMTVLLRTDKHADAIKKLADIVDGVENDTPVDNDMANTHLDGDIACNVHYR